MDLFNEVPYDLLYQILDLLDAKEFFQFVKLIPEYNKEYVLTLARKKIYYQTGLRSNHFDMERLESLSHIRYNRNICAGKGTSLITKFHGDTYQLGLEPNNILQTDPLAPMFKLNNVVQICIGHKSFLLTSQGKVYSFGYNVSYESHYEGIYDPKLMTDIEDVVQMSHGDNHMLFLLSNGTVLGCGNNISGQLGPNMGYYQNKFIIDGLDDIIQVATGFGFSLALRSDGCVYGFGDNSSGQLGIPMTKCYNNVFPPILIPNLTNIVQIATEYRHSLALTIDGKVYAWGDNQLGLSDINSTNIPTLIPNIDKIVSVSTRYNYSLLLSERGEVYAFGNNGNGQLSMVHRNIIDAPIIISGLSNIIQISTGTSHYLALDNKGNVYGMGLNNMRQLGLNMPFTTIPNIIPSINLTDY